MPYTNDPANSAIDRLRLRSGDTDPDREGLSDSEYQYFLDTYGTEFAAYVEALKALVSKYGKYTRERTAQIEIYGQDIYDNYRKLLDDALSSDPRKGNFKIGAGVSGGVSKQRVQEVRDNKDSNYTKTYQGWSTDSEFTSYDEKSL